MNPMLNKLREMAESKERRIIGLMSGTSMDGLDIALCRFRGSGAETTFELEHFESVEYPEDVREQLISFAVAESVNPELICIWHTKLAHIHAGYINSMMKKRGLGPADIDLIASHGQTVYHAPRHKHGMEDMPNATWQIVDGDHIAVLTGITTISDFRQRDTARGNEGAPLAAYGDYLLFSHPEKHRVLLNIGGISNFTWLPAGKGAFPPVSYDTGPGNTLIDAATRKHFSGMSYDVGGGLAARGTVHDELLSLLKAHPYFERPAPKTTGFEVFNLNWVEECIEDLGLELKAEDLLATLTRLTADTVAGEIRKAIPDNEKAEVCVSGGGAYNDTLMAMLARALDPVPVRNSEDLGVSPDAKEALFFAALANELVCGEDTRLHLGKISLPDV
ncbi:anhydro-N-acetylmuramic acid kinase [Natronogracilivirga saccharolytica]|nr:anhydro-N-acetylmuramic acid kinase [Natronogracilivirga saccharolytica]